MGAKRNDNTADGEAPGRTQTVELPARIVQRVDHRVERTDFASPAAYITFVLEETLARVEDREGAESGDDQSDHVTEEEVRSRLESLGYVE